MVPLVVFMTAAFLFALSCNISFNQHVLFHYELKGFFLKMANSFRASGRFIWPIYYFILLIIFYHINKLNLKSALKNSVLVFCFVLQIIDLKGFFLPAHTKCDAYAPPISASWEKLIQSFDKIVFFPGFTRTYLTFDDYKYFTYYAGKYHKKINIGYLARFNMAEAISFTSRLNREITENGLDDRTLYITLPPYFNRLLLPIEDNKAHSLYLDGYYAIFKKIPVHEKLFDEIARTEGDKINHKIQWKPVELEKRVIDLIQKSNGIKTNVYEKDESEDHFYIKGWAFSEESSDNLHDSVTLILATRGKTYFSVPVYRFYTDDVAGFFKNPKLNRSGFGISFLKRSLREGNYSVGLLLTNSSNGYEALRWTDTDFTVLRKLAPIPVNGAPLNAAELRLSIETIRDNEKEIDLAGWAFPSSGICPSCKNFVFLSSPEKNYEVEFFSNPRPDVVTFFKNDTSLLYSGIKVGIQKSDLLPATYNVGVIMRDTIHNKEYFSLSDKLIKAGVSDFAQPTLLNEIPSGHDEIRAFIDTIEDYDSVVHITGWAFIDSLSTDLSHCTFALQSGDLLYEVAADRTYRVDLKSFFKLSYNTDWAGLSVRINKKDLSMGRYQLCVVMFNKSSGEKTIHCLDNYIEIPPHP